MNQIWTVALRELFVTLRRPSFYVATFAIPAITGLLFFGSAWLNSTFAPGRDTSDPSASAIKPSGVVDQANIVKNVPESLDHVLFTYPDEATALAAVRAGQIGSYYLIAPDYLQSGRVVRVSNQVSLSGASSRDTRALELLLRTSLTDDPALSARLGAPLDLDTEIVGSADAQARAEQPGLSSGISFGLAFLLAFAILNGGGGLVQSVAEEKENRTIEIVLTSVRPWQFMVGKLLGLGTISLIQLGLWLIFGRGLLGLGQAVGQLDLRTSPLSIWPWIIAFFLLGYLFYGGIMAAVGALGATARESGQVSGFMTLPLLMPLWFGSAITDAPDGVLSLIFSLIPFTAPVTIMLRLGQGPVPVLHLVLSVGFLALGVLGVTWLAARLFRATTLLTGVKPTPRAVLQALRG